MKQRASMKWKIYQAETGELLDDFEVKETLPPPPGERITLADGEKKKVIKAEPAGDAAKGKIYIAVKVR